MAARLIAACCVVAVVTLLYLRRAAQRKRRPRVVRISWCLSVHQRPKGARGVLHPARKGFHVGIIPARFASSRFPGKPLALIGGRPMIERTWAQAMQAKRLDAVYVATDHEGIAAACRAFGARVLMTSVDCPNGTERCREAHAQLPSRYDIVVNIQGDEPLLEPEVIDCVVAALQDAPDAVYSTACTPLSPESVELPQRVKCVTDKFGYALYFSRSMIPGCKAAAPRTFPHPFSSHQYQLHLGLQCYDADFLDLYATLPETPLMLMEDLEQLKVLEHGFKIKVVPVQHCAFGVDTPGDVEVIERLIQGSASALNSQ